MARSGLANFGDFLVEPGVDEGFGGDAAHFGDLGNPVHYRFVNGNEVGALLRLRLTVSPGQGIPVLVEVVSLQELREFIHRIKAGWGRVSALCHVIVVPSHARGCAW